MREHVCMRIWDSFHTLCVCLECLACDTRELKLCICKEILYPLKNGAYALKCNLKAYARM